MISAKWISAGRDTGSCAVSFNKSITLGGKVASAMLTVSAVGVYEAYINGKKVGDRVLAPGFTSYNNRVQYQQYDVTHMLEDNSSLCVVAAPGWAVGHMGYKGKSKLFCDKICVIAQMNIKYEDGTEQTVITDTDWEVWTHEVTFADIYHGETVDKTLVPELVGMAEESGREFNLIADEGEKIQEQEIICPAKLITTPKGEKVIDFEQNLTGYVSLKIKGNKGDRVRISFAEVLDKDGNFYNDNYRGAKVCAVTYVLSGNEDSFKPRFSFQGFRYVRIDEYPDTEIELDGFRAVVVHSSMKRLGHFTCGDSRINQLYHNIIWGQKSNYLDIPTDCPQRDERLGWTGDAQIFCRTAGINYDIRKFFHKWLGDLRCEQRADGAVMGTSPEADGMHNSTSRISAGWGDAATIIPWTIYELYGDKTVLEENFDMMRGWVEYMRSAGSEEFLWLEGYHYGDWLAMDAGEDSYMGATANDLVATAFYAYSTELLVRSGEVLGKDMSEYKTLHKNIVATFRKYFMENGMPKDEFPLTEALAPARTKHVDIVRKGMTQTALVLILHFNLCLPEERQAIADKLEELIHDFGDRMSTGFLGTPYILHALSAMGKNDLAYKLFFNNQNPSWLYSVDHGATTMWEHWNSLKEDGSFWSTDMNSFNHYAYGAVADWMYGVVAGIKIEEAGYKRVTLAPCPCERLGFVRCSIETPCGMLESNWYYTDDGIRYEFVVPKGAVATVVLPDGRTDNIGEGSYCYATGK